MAKRWKCVRGIILPDPENRSSARAGQRYLRGDVFEADEPRDWLAWAQRVGVLRETDEPLTGPPLVPSHPYPSEKILRDDGSYSDPEPSMEHVED